MRTCVLCEVGSERRFRAGSLCVCHIYGPFLPVAFWARPLKYYQNSDKRSTDKAFFGSSNWLEPNCQASDLDVGGAYP